MTPIPLLLGFIIKKCFEKKEESTANSDPATKSMLNDNEVEVSSSNSQNKNEQT